MWPKRAVTSTFQATGWEKKGKEGVTVLGGLSGSLPVHNRATVATPDHKERWKMYLHSGKPCALQKTTQEKGQTGSRRPQAICVIQPGQN